MMNILVIILLYTTTMPIFNPSIYAFHGIACHDPKDNFQVFEDTWGKKGADKEILILWGTLFMFMKVQSSFQNSWSTLRASQARFLCSRNLIIIPSFLFYLTNQMMSTVEHPHRKRS